MPRTWPDTRDQYQVIIVGGGPVGMALAVDLGQRGVSCLVLERRLTPQRIPKGQNLSQRTLEHFFSWGCVDRLRAARLLPAGYPIGGVTVYGDLTSDYWYAPAGREVVSPYYFQENDRLPQYLTEEVLRARAAELPSVSCRFGWAATEIEQDDRGVWVHACRETGRGERAVFAAGYVVGCDGSHSMVRSHLGVERSGSDFAQRMVLAVFRSRELHERLRRFPERTTYRVLHPDLRGYWQFFGRVDVGEEWFFHAPLPADATPETCDVRDLLERAAGFSFPCTFEHTGFWDLRVEVARSYRGGRAFIAGDASHSHPPYGGFGLNTGLEDVANLGWKLSGVVEGWGGDRLLESYGDERQPIFSQTGEDVIARDIERDRAFLERYHPERDRREFEEAWSRLAAQPSWARTYEPHYEGSPVVLGPPGGHSGIHGAHSFAARPGHHLAPRRLSDGSNAFERLGPGFTLFAFGSQAERAGRLQDAARSLGIPLSVVRDTYEGERAAYEAPLVLVRPDQYVAWAGEELPHDVLGALRRVAGS